MDLTVEQVNGRVPVTVLRLRGSLDASNFAQLISKARELYSAGSQRLLLDLTDLGFMGSSGLVALRSIALLARGAEPPDLEHGWAAFHALGQDRGSGAQPYVKLLNPHANIVRTLQVTGMTEFFEIYHDRQAAVASFE
ncbi:MAG TPA: STAS domain-containing protein [Roseiflexaceae bacterium]|nr:STAS domain-containing protein [Roseiflexaceae bacterium]